MSDIGTTVGSSAGFAATVPDKLKVLTEKARAAKHTLSRVKHVRFNPANAGSSNTYSLTGSGLSQQEVEWNLSSTADYIDLASVRLNGVISGTWSETTKYSSLENLYMWIRRIQVRMGGVETENVNNAYLVATVAMRLGVSHDALKSAQWSGVRDLASLDYLQAVTAKINNFDSVPASEEEVVINQYNADQWQFAVPSIESRLGLLSEAYGGRISFSIPLSVFGSFQVGDKYFPLPSYPINIIITLQDNADVLTICNGAAQPTGYAYTLSKLNLQCDLIEIDSALASELNKAMMTKPVFYHFDTYHTNSSASATIGPTADSYEVSLTNSMRPYTKQLIVFPRKTADITDKEKLKTASANLCELVEIGGSDIDVQLQISDQVFPRIEIKNMSELYDSTLACGGARAVDTVHSACDISWNDFLDSNQSVSNTLHRYSKFMMGFNFAQEPRSFEGLNLASSAALAPTLRGRFQLGTGEDPSVGVTFMSISKALKILKLEGGVASSSAF